MVIRSRAGHFGKRQETVEAIELLAGVTQTLAQRVFKPAQPAEARPKPAAHRRHLRTAGRLVVGRVVLGERHLGVTFRRSPAQLHNTLAREVAGQLCEAPKPMSASSKVESLPSI